MLSFRGGYSQILSGWEVSRVSLSRPGHRKVSAALGRRYLQCLVLPTTPSIMENSDECSYIQAASTAPKIRPGQWRMQNCRQGMRAKRFDGPRPLFVTPRQQRAMKVTPKVVYYNFRNAHAQYSYEEYAPIVDCCIASCCVCVDVLGYHEIMAQVKCIQEHPTPPPPPPPPCVQGTAAERYSRSIYQCWSVKRPKGKLPT